MLDAFGGEVGERRACGFQNHDLERYEF